MEEYAYIEFLVEDESGKILINRIMDKYVKGKSNIIYRTHGFKGIGKIPRNASNISQIKSKRLLQDLPSYLKGFDLSLKHLLGKKAIFVILDCDDADCVETKFKLMEMYRELNVTIPVYFCIAIEEIEAWLLGDQTAVLTAYPSAKRQLLQRYIPDSIVGTWECLADIVYKGGLQALKRDATSYYEIGRFKCDCAKNIGAVLEIERNNSPSFKYFISKLNVFIDDTVS